METFGAFLDEDSDFMLNLNLNGSDLFSNKVQNGLSFLANCAEENVEDSVFFPSDTLDCTTNFYYVSQESSNNSSEIDAVIFPSQENIVNNLDVRSYTRDDQSTLFSDNHNLLTDHLGDYVKEMQLKRKPETPEEKMEENSSESPKKKSRVTGDVSRNKQGMVPSKKNEKVTQNSDEEIKKTNGGGSGPSSSSCIYEDDCNGSLESLKSNAKARASRGSATDPQSLYARKRRERINERLKILQNIVPNGTKVDISTMLEEAVHYVKFLQLQIKLLSSDGTWMYAPIAYNGQNIGLY